MILTSFYGQRMQNLGWDCSRDGAGREEISRYKIIHWDANAAYSAAGGDTPVILALGRVGQADGEFEASLSYIVI